jgi:hypothetical protein
MEDIALRKRKPQAKVPDDFVARFAAEKAAVQRHYCTVFELWKGCARKSCRRARACTGDQNACLQHGLEHVPQRVQQAARLLLLKTTPASAGPPERTAREFIPCDFYRTVLFRKEDMHLT